MRRLAAAYLARSGATGGAGRIAGLTRGAYRIAFRTARVGADRFFVPGYALHRPASRAILAGRPFEPATHRLVARLLTERPGSMVHAGTFFGDMLPGFSRACPGTVHAFEPVLENYVLARATLEANALANVALIHAGLGAAAGVARVSTHEPSGAHRGGASAIAEAGQSCALLTVDGLAIADLSVLQLDVEGHELDALRGAEATIRGSRPAILIEDGPDRCPPFLGGLGYREIGRIPGQKVWAPAERAGDLARLLD